MDPIINGAGLFDGEQTAKEGLPDFHYRSVPAGITPQEAATNLRRDQVWCRHPPPDWTHLSRAGFSYRPVPGGIVQAAAEAFNLDRLDGVHQFDFKINPETKHRWPQTRFGHSFDVAAMANLLAHHNADALPANERKALVVAALLHDVLMPPGGETIKHIDMARFDEDANFPALIESDAFWEFACLKDVDAPAVARIMREEGAAGTLKDLADKIGYVCRDVDQLLTGYGQISEQIRRRMEQNPCLAQFWRSIRIKDGQVVIDNVDSLCDFLELRALLFAYIYQNPDTRSDGYVYSEVILRWLYETRQLSAEEILTMTDEDLDRIVDRYVDWTDGEHVDRTLFDTIEDARAVQAGLSKQGVIFTTVVDYSKGCKPATHFLVPTPNGPKPLFEAYPERASEIERLAESACGIYLFSIREPKADLRTGLLAELTRHRKCGPSDSVIVA